MEAVSKESEIIKTLKEKLDLTRDEAKKIFSTIEDKLPEHLEHEEILKVVRLYITKKPIKSVLIAIAFRFVIWGIYTFYLTLMVTYQASFATALTLLLPVLLILGWVKWRR